MKPFANAYAGRTVLVTGHTGFKGSWLSAWLVELGAKVVGYALDPPSEPSHFDAIGLAERMVDVRGDVRDYERLAATFAEHRPSVVLHLAAQAIVRKGFDDPRQTFDANFMGTVNVLEAARLTDSVEAVVCITSDKCYANQEWPWGYRETDRLGGHDPYSASKAAAELAIAVYQDRRFQARAVGDRWIPIASARAGNVIGGGDWAADRLIPDVVRAIASGRDIVLRNPHSTRPWQHVLEALSGYLWLGALMLREPDRFTSAYNFGPRADVRASVQEVVDCLLEGWPGHRSTVSVEPDHATAESRLLRLDCERAESELGWRATWELDETLERIVSWYRAFYEDPRNGVYECTASEIESYVCSAREKRIAWATAGV